MVLEAAAKDENGKELFKEKRIFMPQCTDSLGSVMVLGPDRKLGIVRDTTLQPFKPKRESFVISLGTPCHELTLRVRLYYELRPGQEIPL
ncbi:MAG: multiheme c-type cytochrome ExtKL, partial [Pseudomonadota bacterium]